MSYETPRPPSQSRLPSGFSVTSFGCKQNDIYHFSNPPLSNLEAHLFGKRSLPYLPLLFTSPAFLLPSPLYISTTKEAKMQLHFSAKGFVAQGHRIETFRFHLHYSHPEVLHPSTAVSRNASRGCSVHGLRLHSSEGAGVGYLCQLFPV